MKILYKKINCLIKKICLIIIMVAPSSTLLAEINEEKWTNNCDKNNHCIMIIVRKANSENNERLLTIYIANEKTSENKMDLISETDKTYKLKKIEKITPYFFVLFPLNVDLLRRPAIYFEGKKLFDFNYTHCNGSVGCEANISLSSEIIKIFKGGKKIDVAFAVRGEQGARSFEIPLKGFSKTIKGP